MVELSFDKAKEWYKKGGELKEIALQAYTEKELTTYELPKTWEEFLSIDTYIKTGLSGVHYISFYNLLDRLVCTDRRKEYLAHLAFMKLHLLRDCYRQGWRQEDNAELCYVINKVLPNHYEIMGTGGVSRFLSFPTKEMAKGFLNNFRELIEQAGDLI
ncbi:MAG: hypothetical protein ACI4TK_03820 [Agathobacter sp.]